MAKRVRGSHTDSVQLIEVSKFQVVFYHEFRRFPGAHFVKTTRAARRGVLHKQGRIYDEFAQRIGLCCCFYNHQIYQECGRLFFHTYDPESCVSSFCVVEETQVRLRRKG